MPHADPTADLAALAATAAAFAAASRAPATRRAYAADWRDFAAWCAGHGLTALPATPHTVALYLADRAATLKPSTLGRRLAALAVTHRDAGRSLDLHDPLLRAVWRGIRRSRGTAPVAKAPLLPDALAGVLAALPRSLAGTRDRALLLLGFAAALRRSELVALAVGDLAHGAAGLTVTVRRGKSDPEGAGSRRAVPRSRDAALCPVRAVTDWILAAGLTTGPLFRPIDRFDRVQPGGLAPRAVARIVKRAVAAAARAQGLPAALVAARTAEVAGHSLRAGLITAALAHGAEEAAVMRQSGHRSRRGLHAYVRHATLFDDNAATRIGL